MVEEERRAQCKQHQENMIRGAVAEQKIRDLDEKTGVLFDKMDAMETALQAVQVTLARVDVKMTTLCGKFDALDDRMDRFEERFDARVAVSNGIIDEYREAIISINTRFHDVDQSIVNGNRSVRAFMETAITTVDDSIDKVKEALDDHITEYRKFDFFRKPIIEGRDTLPKFIAKWILISAGALLFVLALSHQTDVARLLRSVGILK